MRTAYEQRANYARTAYEQRANYERELTRELRDAPVWKAMKESIQEIKEKLDTKIGHILADRGTELMGEFRGLLKTKQNPK